MGLDVGALTAEGLCAGDEAMVLALLWQLAHAVLLAPVNVQSCTELESLLLPGEEQSLTLTLTLILILILTLTLTLTLTLHLHRLAPYNIKYCSYLCELAWV